MRRKGINNFKRVPNLYFRACEEEDLKSEAYRPNDRIRRDWKPQQAAYVIIISRKDCVDEDDEWDRDLIKAAPAIPFSGWSLTNMVYGIWRKNNGGRRFWTQLDKLSKEEQVDWRATYEADKEAGVSTDSYWALTGADGDCVVIWHWHPVYWTKAVYWVEDNCVYRGTIYLDRDLKETE